MIYFAVYIVSVAAVFFTFRNRLYNIEKNTKRMESIIFGDGGGLNIINQQECKARQDHVFNAIRRSESSIEKTLSKIEQLNENILKIMFILKIDDKEE